MMLPYIPKISRGLKISAFIILFFPFISWRCSNESIDIVLDNDMSIIDLLVHGGKNEIYYSGVFLVYTGFECIMDFDYSPLGVSLSLISLSVLLLIVSIFKRKIFYNRFTPSLWSFVSIVLFNLLFFFKIMDEKTKPVLGFYLYSRLLLVICLIEIVSGFNKRPIS